MKQHDKNISIAFFDAKEYDRKFFNQANTGYNFTIKYFDDKLSAETAALAEGAEVVCAFVNDDL
ncbi:MAG: hypothetical protein WC071_02325, partial [Victivallaceae bacterium]